MDAESAPLADEDYRQLLEFRTGLRAFLDWSARQARQAGLTPAQHQLLLAIRRLGRTEPPTVGQVAQALLLRHHSVVELVGRAEAAGLVIRRRDRDDARMIRLRLTRKAEATLARLSALHRAELARLRPRLQPLWEGLDGPSS